MSMDEDDDEDEAEDREGVRAALRKERSKSNLLSPPFALGPDGQPAMINRQELDDQERLDLEEEKRERELNGQGFPGFGTQHAGQGNSTAAPQPGKFRSGSPFIFHQPLIESRRRMATCVPSLRRAPSDNEGQGDAGGPRQGRSETHVLTEFHLSVYL